MQYHANMMQYHANMMQYHANMMQYHANMMQYHANMMPCDCITGKAAKEAEAAIHKMRKHIRQNVRFLLLCYTG